MSRQELRFTGSGGQGVILATVIFSEAALLSGKHTTQSQSYGPEARGGLCKAEVLVSDEAIGFTKVQSPTFLMALTEKSLNKYGPCVPETCLVLIDSSLSIPESMKKLHIVSLPILETAKQVVGKPQTANIVAVGCINELLKVSNTEVLEKAVAMHVPYGTQELNLLALHEGMKLVSANCPEEQKEEKK